MLFSPDSFGFIEGVVDGPLDANGFGGVFVESLVKHGFPCEFCMVPMFVFDEGVALLAVEVDVFDLSPGGEVFVKSPHHVFDWRQRVSG